MRKNNLGDVISFGRYPQRGSSAEPIEWIVLEQNEETAKLISKLGLTAKKYNETGYWPVTWENCSLRKWLNNEFLNAAFSEEERERLNTVTVEAECNQDEDTQDSVFLLNDEEAERYFDSCAARLCQPTANAVAEGAYVKAGYGWWWLTTPSISMPNFVYVVDVDGSFDKDGFPVDAESILVRPVVVMRLS